MEIRDLLILPPDHSPSPYRMPVVDRGATSDRHAVLPPNLSLCAIGWLGAAVPTQGATPPECIDRLVKALDSVEVINDGLRGYHDCEVCEALGTFFAGTDGFSRHHFRGFGGQPLPLEMARGMARSQPVIKWRETEFLVRAIGHHLIQLDRVVYMCPQLLLHYILHHDYRPPDEFVQAVAHGRFLTFEDLVIMSEGAFKAWIEKLHTK